MGKRPPASAPGSGRPRAGRRPAGPSGSTRRTSRVGPTAASPPVSARSKLTGRAFILLMVLAVLAVSYASSAQAWLKQRSEINALTAEISDREAAVAELEQMQARWHDDDFIETQARARLGWVMPGEVGYRVIDDDGSVIPDGGSTLSVPVDPIDGSAEPQWWESAWGSVVEAGTDPSEKVKHRPERQPAERINGTEPRSSQPPR